MTGAATDLNDVTDAMSFAGVDAANVNIYQVILSAVSVEIQAWLGYNVASASYTKTFNGNGSQRMLLPDRPVTAVTSLTIDGISVPPSVNQSSGFLFDSKSLYLIGQYRFCGAFQNTTVVYTAGYSSVPMDIVLACNKWCKLIWDRAQRSETDLTEYAAGTISKKYMLNKFQEAIGGFGPLPIDIGTLLMVHKRVSPS